MPIKTLYPIIKKDLDFQGGEKLETLLKNLCIIKTNTQNLIQPIIMILLLPSLITYLSIIKKLPK